MNQTERRWLTWRKVACVSLLLLAAIYIYAEPTLEQWLGVDLPSINVGEQRQPDVPDNRAADHNQQRGQQQREQARHQPAGGDSNRAESSDSGFQLETLADGSQRSPAGLVYTRNPRETRIQHVMRHAQDEPDRPIHGVFDEKDETQILRMLDEAYRLILAKSPRVKSKASSQAPDRTEHIVDMQRRIGYVGGQTGKRKDFPEARFLKLVLAGDHVITAFPDNRQ